MNRCRMCNQIILQDGTEDADWAIFCEECKFEEQEERDREDEDTL